MQVWRKICILLIAITLGIFTTNLPVAAENSTVTIGVGDTTLKVSGSTSPGALVTIVENGAVIGTATADANGDFMQVLPNQAPGVRTFELFAQDTDGRLTDSVTRSVNIQEFADTELKVFLPPTVYISPSEVVQGGQVVVQGASAPNSTIAITLDAKEYFTVSTDANGRWQYTLPTSSLAAGDHVISVVAIKGGGEQSAPSSARKFVVQAPEVTPPSTSGPTPGQPSTAIPPPVITSPKNGDVVTGDSVTVEGTAEPGTQIEVWNRDVLIGSVFADANGRWRLSFTPQEAANMLKARACRNQVCSEFSASVSFFWQRGVGAGLTLRLSAYRYATNMHDTLTLEAIIRGGQPPYTLTIDWGDGTTETLTTSNLTSWPTHIYGRAGQFNGVVTATDSQHRMAIAHFSVEVTGESGQPWWLLLLLALLGLLLILLAYCYYRHRKSRRG